MFTQQQISAAYGKVKSGADFPAYIRDLKHLGVTSYETFVSDGHTVFYGAGGYATTTPAKYEALNVKDSSSDAQFKSDLKAHQLGKTDYPTFCRNAAGSGIEKWEVRMEDMTCTYFDREGKSVLVEEIPA